MKERPILFSSEMVRSILDDRKTQTRRVLKPSKGLPQPVNVEPWIIDGIREYDNDGRPLWAGSHDDYPTGQKWFSCPYGKPGDRNFTSFRESEPPSDGWYCVKWNPSDSEVFVKLTKVEEEPCDDPVDHPVWLWVWQESDSGDPESICLDCRDPLSIQWKRPGDRLWVRESWYQGREKLWYKADIQDLSKCGISGWKPSIHMPRSASRITLEITDIRLQRLQDISEEDAIAEGVEFYDTNPKLWRDYLYVDGDYSVKTAAGYESPIDSFRTLWDSINSDRGYSWGVNPWVWAVSFRKI